MPCAGPCRGPTQRGRAIKPRKTGLALFRLRSVRSDELTQISPRDLGSMAIGVAPSRGLTTPRVSYAKYGKFALYWLVPTLAR